jgi:hypothetical protein
MEERTMSNVVSIDKHSTGHGDSFLGEYIESQNNQRIPEVVFFVAGAILTIGLPELYFSIYGGLIPFFVFAGCLLSGAGLGVGVYRFRSPYQILAINGRTVSQVTPSKEDTTKKAA